MWKILRRAAGIGDMKSALTAENAGERFAKQSICRYEENAVFQFVLSQNIPQ